jgi:tetratricopeptide (TPR) repeat protein
LAYKVKGDYAKASADYEAALQLDPGYWNAHNNLAWLLASCPEDGLRDGEKAVKHATAACELTGWRKGICLGTLAGAYAELGRFDEAVRWQVKAGEDAEYRQKEGAKAELRVDLYRQGKPFRDQRPPV